MKKWEIYKALEEDREGLEALKELTEYLKRKSQEEEQK